MRKKERLFVILILAAFCFGSAGFVTKSWSQAPTYTVQKGDTLWSICQEYYGDPELWPKLWEMNPFITNPHLLRVGDVITLMEKQPAEEPPAVEMEAAEPASAMEESVKREMGVDISGMTNVESIGFFSQVNPEPLGRVLSSEAQRLLSSEGDTVSITVEGGGSVRLGDVLIAYDTRRLFKDALERHDLGYVIRVLGKLVVREEIEGSLYKAEITESYAPIPPDALIGSHAPISSCVKSVPTDSQVNTGIIATKGQRSLISQFSIVYLSLGYDDGIRRGNLFEIVGERASESADKGDLYAGILGHMLVLETRPGTATGVVISAKREFSKDVSLRGLDLTRAQDILSNIPECPIE